MTFQRSRLTRMTLSEFTRKQIDEKLKTFCEGRVPAHARNDVRLGWKVRGNNVTLYEARPSLFEPNAWDDRPVAQFRFDATTKTWELYQPGRNGRWHWYIEAVATPNFDALLAEVAEDPTSIFWG